MRVFLKRMAMLFCMCVFLMENAHFAYADDLTLVESHFAAPEGYSGMIQVPGMGEMRYYAQNDPLWGALCYEKHDIKSRRPFRDSGCSPSSLAMAIAKMIPIEEMGLIEQAAKNDFSICSCSLNKSRCIRDHARYIITSQRDFVRFLPLVFGDYAAGNNINGTYSRSATAGTNSAYMKEVANLYGLDMTIIHDFDQALEEMEKGNAVVALAAAGGVFTNTGHYVFLANYYEGKLYVLDPLYRTTYKTKNSKRLEIIQPGLVALTDKNIRYAQFTNFYIFTRQ